MDAAARNTAALENVHCIQADLLALPLAAEAFDFVYCLGVLHHLRDTERALAGLVSRLKPGDGCACISTGSGMGGRVSCFVR